MINEITFNCFRETVCLFVSFGEQTYTIISTTITKKGDEDSFSYFIGIFVCPLGAMSYLCMMY